MYSETMSSSAGASKCAQVIVFSFSKKECEALALQMAPLDLNDEAEQKLVEGIFWNAVDCLSDDDRRLPQASTQPGRVSRRLFLLFFPLPLIFNPAVPSNQVLASTVYRS